ncbi:MAG: hypothetical protein R6X15_05760 [Pseudomonadota bacterium]
MNSKKILEISLLAGALYFLCIAIAHTFDYKIPGLFIYYNIPSFQYQDKIISFLAFGWAAFFYAGSRNIEIIKPLLLTVIVGIAGLVNINLSTEFNKITDLTTPTPFWLQTFLITLYAIWLMLFTVKTWRQ